MKIPAVLRAHVGGEKSLEGKPGTLRELIDDLASQHPSLRGEILTDEGELRRFVNVYLNDEDVRYLKGLETPVSEGDTLSILPAVAGGYV